MKADRALAVLAALLQLLSWGAQAEARAGAKNPVLLHETRLAGSVQVSAENTDPDCVRWVWVSLRGAQNILTQPALPAGFALQPLETRDLFTVLPASPGEGYSYALSELSGEGDPTRDPDPGAVYLLPFAHGTKHLVSQGYFGRMTHQGLYALDFDMPDGTAVDAARSGVVIAVKQDSDSGGPSAAYAGEGNYIQVMHPDATWAIYAHLQQGGSLVQKGQTVRAGEEIGLSGHTGEATGPHLHFAVYRADWAGPRSMPTVFMTGPSSTASLEEGMTYYAWHPGLAPFVPVLGADLKDADFAGLTRKAQGSGVHLRQEVVDRRVLVWADNATGADVDIAIDVAEAQGVRFGAELPFRIKVPAGREVYAFHADYVGDGPSAFQLKASWLAPAAVQQ